MFCSNCGSQLNQESKFCGGCGRPHGGAQSTEDNVYHPDLNTSNASPNPNKKTIGILIGVGAFLGVLILLGVTGAFEDGNIKECKRLVTEGLKVPSSAEFSDVTVEYGTDGETGEQSISVEGNVSAMNGFGAMIPGDFWCSKYNTDYLELEYLN